MTDDENVWINAADIKKLLGWRHWLEVEVGLDDHGVQQDPEAPPKTVKGLAYSGVIGKYPIDGICLHEIASGNEDGCNALRVRVRRWTRWGMKPLKKVEP